VHGKSAGNGGLALAFCRFSPSRKTPRSYLKGSMSLALTRVLVNFAHEGVINEDQPRQRDFLERKRLAQYDQPFRSSRLISGTSQLTLALLCLAQNTFDPASFMRLL
jgi:hypothetical protein